MTGVEWLAEIVRRVMARVEFVKVEATDGGSFLSHPPQHAWISVVGDVGTMTLTLPGGGNVGGTKIPVQSAGQTTLLLTMADAEVAADIVASHLLPPPVSN